MLKKFFEKLNGEAKSISSAAFLIGTATFASKILGLFRDRVLAGIFGASRDLDIYYASFRIPDLVFTLVVLGTLSAGFIPVFSDYLKKDSKKSWELVNNTLNILVLGLVILSGIFIFSAPVLMQWITPGFHDDDLHLTVNLSRIMFLSPILLGIAGVFSGVLQAQKKFFVYSLAPIFYNIGIISGAIFLVPYFGVYGLAWGVVLGAFLHLVVHIPTLLKLGYRFRPILFFAHKGTRKIFSMMIPRFLSLSITQVNLVVVTILTSLLEEGSITVFNFANNIQSVPLMFFGISYAIAAFPTLSENADNKEKFIESFSLTFREILFFIIPFSALFILLRAQIVRTILGSGSFDWEDTILTMNTLAVFSISLFAQSLVYLLTRAFFALKDSFTPFLTGLVSTAVNIGLSVYFVFWTAEPSVEHIALAYTISQVVHLLILWMILKLRLVTLDETRISLSIFTMVMATVFMGLAVQGMKYFIEPIFGTRTFLGIALQGSLSGAIGIFIYFVVSLTLESPEAGIFLSSLRRKFFKRFTPTETVE